ncbi:MAG: ATP-dependent Clp protease ATP-binding subunit ClpX [Planctomycetota bacterium]|jgi:ATP-dependent Clp protease ATP-binding subunit ClpX
MAKTPTTEKCSFCGKPKDEAVLLVSGIDAHICENCIEQAELILSEEVNKNATGKFKFALSTDIKPKGIKAFLDEYIIDQHEAKRTIAVAVYNHYKRLNQKKNTDIEIEKSNILLVGRTGTGKTLIAKSIAKFLNVPFTIVDATVFTEAGYVGEDVESILSRLLQVCDFDLSAAEKGIIYIDEIDKVARKADNPSLTRDVSGEGVQQAMLKLLEGSEVLVAPQGGRKHPDQKMIKVNTENILFICGGAFSGIERNIGNRLNTSSVGFKSENDNRNKLDTDNLLQYITPDDLKSFGLIPELIGRIPSITHLNPLTEDALFRILTEPKNAITKQYAKLFEYENIDFSFSEDALKFIAATASQFQTGARGLRYVCEAICKDAMFDLPSEENVTAFVVTLEYAKEKLTTDKVARLAKVA